MKKITIIFSMLLLGASLHAQTGSIFGKWKTIDDNTGEAKSIVEIYKKDGKVYGKIVDIINPASRDKICINCKGEDKNKPLIGLDIIKELEKDDDEYDDGTITDPENGKVYDAKIWLDEDNADKLNVRGYVSFLYRTQQWKRM